MDNSSLRRGCPTNHMVYGEDTAILAGDALLSGSFEHVAKGTKNVPAERVVEVIRRLGETVGLNGLAGGQTMDLECAGRKDVTLDDLRWIHTHKTGTLLRLAAASGAVIAVFCMGSGTMGEFLDSVIGATEDDIARVERYAENVGLAFQVADDILDVTQSTENLGKTAGKDLDASKTTYPKLLGIEESRRVAQRLIDEAVEALAPYKARAASMVGIAKYIVERTH